jgi:hypothetical protein
MSDIDNHSYGRETSSWVGIRTSLTEVERRLGELQVQLDPRQSAMAPPGAMHTPSPIDIARETLGARTDTIAPTLDPSIGAPPSNMAGVGFMPAPFSPDSAARQSADEIIAEARATAHELIAAAEAQVGLVKEQVEQLLLARETLRKSLRGALADCESSLARFERGEQPSQSRGAQSPLGELSQLPQQGGWPSGKRQPATPGAIELEGGAGRFAPGGIAPGGIAHAPKPPDVFEGSVSLRVGPLRDISQVDTLEIALLQVPGAERVEVKEFAGSDAVAVIKLFQPVPLIEELRRVLPFQFDVSGGGPDTLTLIAIGDEDTDRLSDASASSQAGGE